MGVRKLVPPPCCNCKHNRGSVLPPDTDVLHVISLCFCFVAFQYHLKYYICIWLLLAWTALFEMLHLVWCSKMDLFNYFYTTEVIYFWLVQIPQSGWNNLFISLVPADSGKATGKTNKANVRNGSCKWSDPIYETTRLLQDSKTRQYEEKIYKLR